MRINRQIWWFLSGLTLLWTLGVAWHEAALAADTLRLDCPRGQAVWLEGEGRPYTGLLILLRGRAVGGGSVGADGRWRLPLQVDEPQGIYPGAVVERADRSELLRFTCYVDRPIADEPPTPTGSIAPARTAAATPSPTLTATRTPPPEATAASQPSPTPTASPSPSPSTTATRTATATATATPVPPEQLVSPTATSLAGVADKLRFGDVGVSDPSTSGSYGYAEIISSATTVIDLTGWQLVNQSRPSLPSFSFPPHQLIARGSVSVILGQGTSTDDTLYWAVDQPIWFTGDTLALRTPQGATVKTVVVP